MLTNEAIARILAAIHPDTTRISVGRASCRKLILKAAYYEIKRILEEEGILE